MYRVIHRRAATALAAALFVTTLGAPLRYLHATCVVAPGEAGELATWLVAGPVATPQGHPRRTVSEQLDRGGPAVAQLRPRAGDALPGPGGARWRAVSAAEARLDLDAFVRGRGARTDLAALDVVTTQDTSAQLFLGSDDGVAVFLDGREVFRRAEVRTARDDDDVVPLALPAGRHTLVLRVYVDAGHARIMARLVGADFRPSAALRLELPGVDDATCDALARQALHFELTREVLADGTRFRAEARYPGGTARREDETGRSVRLAIPGLAAPVTGAISLRGGDAVGVTLEGTAPPSASGTAAIELTQPAGAPPLRRELGIAAPPDVREAIVRSHRLLDAFSEDAPPPWLPRPSLTSLRYVTERLAALYAGADEDGPHQTDEARALVAMLEAVAAQRDPYANRRGPMRRGYRSEIDGSLQGYSVYVPASYTGQRDFPMIVALHGLAGTAHRMLPVLFGLYDEHESRVHADRHLPPLPDAQAIIVAPFGFGDAGYRALGEQDVVRVIAEMRASYRVDATRTYMTGLSMGGIGAAAIPLHYPGLFAAAAPLCGYHSYFVRGDTRGLRRPWETFLMEARSNALWAENGLHLPMYVVHGTLDRPTENSRVLVDRYTELGYRIEAEWPELPHNVWSTTYAGGRIIPHFLRFRRDPAPRRVRFRTAGMRWRESEWVAIDALARHDAWGEVDASVEGSAVRATTHGVSALTLAPPAGLFPTGAAQVEVRIDGDTIATTAGRPLSLRRGAGGHWAEAAREVAPVLGPVRDVFDRPVLVVYGTHSDAQRAMNRRVARAWADVRRGVRAHVQMLPDDQVTDALARTHALVLVGTPESNSYLARIQARLPIRVEGGAVVAGAQRHAGAQVGATFVAPNPEAPGQVVLVVTGTDALGVWRSRFLPDLVPDFAIYDAGVAPARQRVLLGPRARVRAAGYFSPDGTLPAQSADPAASTAPASTQDADDTDGED